MILLERTDHIFLNLKILIYFVSIIFLGLTILWVFPFLGFGSPVALMGGFIFGKWIGTIRYFRLKYWCNIYIFIWHYFLKEIIRENF